MRMQCRPGMLVTAQAAGARGVRIFRLPHEVEIVEHLHGLGMPLGTVRETLALHRRWCRPYWNTQVQ